MTHFMGTYRGRLDRKGRVSVPAAFRTVLERLGTSDVVLRPAHNFACIEGLPLPAFEALTSGLNGLDTFSESQDDLAFSLYADATTLRPDSDGRIVVPEELIAHANLGEEIAFVGLGPRFQMWEPAALARRVAESRQRAKERGLTLPAAGRA
ncbi:division/cell wall cluster transcriptional repressor MraZ [Muricoccus radiodurans]|uniref:division/cell wall cluster transcriptional repressor MraZ n=1 Tax=Muricoccus radiodurans TaxID=2231721 RepID=UPI003CF99C46